ncbi:MAG: SMP-30/gluconolactonase/LRE family protein [Planctomycetales bacterium]|nr:SMP-30/gluconolactonase/LRE family protein [Planctomycetales bacterium]
MTRTCFAGLASVVAVCLASAVGWAEDKGIPHIGPAGEVKELHSGLQFTEGPADDGHGAIYFTDIPADRIYKHTAEGKLETFLEGAGHCNGLMFNAAGDLLACSMDGRLIQIDTATKKITPLAEQFGQKRFNAPNDLVLDKSGGVYFTDPHFRAPDPLPQRVPAVYYRAADGDVTRVATIAKAPNGVILSPDEKTLYVIPSLQAEMLAYPVTAPGKLGEERVFCKLAQPADADGSGGDGLTIDTQGNLYITSRIGVQVWSPAGKHLGTIALPQQPANVTFGGPDRKTLFATCRTGFYSVRMHAQGHVFTGKE